MKYRKKPVVAGDCVACGKPIDDDNIFLCKDCRKKQKSVTDMRRTDVNSQMRDMKVV